MFIHSLFQNIFLMPASCQVLRHSEMYKTRPQPQAVSSLWRRHGYISSSMDLVKGHLDDLTPSSLRDM